MDLLSLDRVSQVNYPAAASGAIRQAVPTYDIASRLSSLVYNGTAVATNPVYNSSSQTTSLSLGNTTQEQSIFDLQTGLLIQQKVLQGANTHVDLEYNYTLANVTNNVGAKTGQLAFIKDNKGTSGNRNRAYTYDKLGRLKQANGGLNGALWSQVYSYDQYGNRTGVTKTGNSAGGGAIESDGIASLTFDATTNRITTGSFAYDEAGNQTQSNENGFIRNYRYDAAGRLSDVKDGSNTLLASYSYGANNQRLQLVESSLTTLYIWEGGSVIAEYDGASNGIAWIKSYVYLGGRLLVTDSTSGVQYHHPDNLGTRLVTNTSGAVVSENIGLPFGTTITGESNNLAGSASKKRFTSYDRSDTTKLDYAVNRHYSSAQGRFTQVDPIGMSAVSLNDPQSLNLYNYCGNDPINHVDPDGLFSLKSLAKIFSFVQKLFKAVTYAVAAVMLIATGNIGLGIMFALNSAAEFSDLLKLPRLANIFRVASDIVSFIVMPASKMTKLLNFKRVLNMAQHVSDAAQTKKLSAIIGLIKLGIAGFETAKEILTAVRTKMVYNYCDVGLGSVFNPPDPADPKCATLSGGFYRVWRLKLNPAFAGGFSDILFRAVPQSFLANHAELGFALFRGITLFRLGKKEIETGIKIKAQIKTISTRSKPSGQLATSLSF